MNNRLFIVLLSFLELASAGNCFCKTVVLYKNQTCSDKPLPDNFPPDALGVYRYKKTKGSGKLMFKNGKHQLTLSENDFVIIFILLYLDTY